MLATSDDPKRCTEGWGTFMKSRRRDGAGDILAQAKFALTDRETLEMLSVRAQMCAKALVIETIASLPEKWAAKQPQGPGSYWPMPGKADRTIRWDMTVSEIDRLIRAFSKFEPFLYIEGVRHFVRKADTWVTDHDFQPGELVHETNREKVFAALDGLVCLTHFVKADENETKCPATETILVRRFVPSNGSGTSR